MTDEERSYMTYGEPPVDPPAETPPVLSARERLEQWMADGWKTDGTPDWLTGGYATKERAATALRLLADEIDVLRRMVSVPPMLRVDTNTGVVTQVDEAADERKIAKPGKKAA